MGPGLGAPKLKAAPQPALCPWHPGLAGAEVQGPPAPTPACQSALRRAPARDSAERALRVSADEGTADPAARGREARGSSGPGTGSPVAPSRGLRAPGPARARRERTGASGARPAGGPRRTGAGRSPGSGASASHSSRAAAAAGAGSPWPGRAPPPQRRGPLLCTPRRAPLPAAPLGIARAGAGRSRVQDLLLAGSAPAAAATETRARVRARRPRFKASRRSGVRQGAPGHPLHLRIALGLSARPAHPAGMQCSQGPHLN